MSRSPLSYPLNRAADTDVGGAADLQTDVMRFMAILSLCLVAIFALVQSIPLTPIEPVADDSPATTEPVAVDSPATTEPVEVGLPATAEPVGGGLPATTEPVGGGLPATAEPVGGGSPATTEPVGGGLPATDSIKKPVTLTRPKWVPKYEPAKREPVVETATEIVAAETPPAPQPPSPEPATDGFVLRFASDAALTRAVAAHHVGFYALQDGRAQRMTVSESRISFWDASSPNEFHEMEASTVPRSVVDALARTGTITDGVDWGVTLPGKMKAQLDALMRDHTGGSLIIGARGDIHWESQ